MKTFEIYDCSPEVKSRIESFEDNLPLDPDAKLWAKYPWAKLAIGQCFIVPFDSAKEGSLRVGATIRRTKTGKIFKVIKHKDLKIFEVARIA